MFPRFGALRSSREREAFPKLFARFAPSLRHPTLRIRNYDSRRDEQERISDLVANAVSSLPHLDSLAIGGTGIEFDLRQRFASTNIKYLTRLPTCIIGNDTFEDFVDDLEPTPQNLLLLMHSTDFLQLKRFTLCLHEGEVPSATMVELGEARGIAVEFKKVADGWTEHFSG